jgi:hypothetical protein
MTRERAPGILAPSGTQHLTRAALHALALLQRDYEMITRTYTRQVTLRKRAAGGLYKSRMIHEDTMLQLHDYCSGQALPSGDGWAMRLQPEYKALPLPPAIELWAEAYARPRRPRKRTT